jgi:hypothetical protein
VEFGEPLRMEFQTIEELRRHLSLRERSDGAAIRVRVYGARDGAPP